MTNTSLKSELATLPIDQSLSQIVDSLRLHPNLVLTAAPGAGKTTRLPAFLLKSGLLSQPNSKIVMLEPRRLAARAAAQRIAEEQNWILGKEVGYQVRFDNKTSAQTQLEILTEGIFSNRIQSDPDLNGIGCLILDEFHERSSQTDLALALARELQQLSRPDLKIVVMSATLETSALSKFLGDCPIIEVPGLLYPVETVWDREPQQLTTQSQFYDRVVKTLKEITEGAKKSAGNVLVFLPGAGEIARVHGEVSQLSLKNGYKIFDLHGGLSLDQQSEVLSPSSEKKLILATNIAESSLTVPGVATVVDTGLAKVLRQEGLGFARLHLSRISKFSAIQRAGRAGREQAGYNYRLWNKQDEASMPDAETPELLRTDLTDTVLILSKLGVSEPNSFSWFQKPTERNLKAAVKTLQRLKAVDESGKLTSTGEKLSRWPAHPRIAALLERSAELGYLKLGARVAALLSERSFIDQSSLLSFAQSDSDLMARLQYLENRNVPDFILRAEKQYSQFGSNRKSAELKLTDREALEEIIFAGFSDRIAKRRVPGELRAKLISGEGVRLHEQSLVKNADFFICLEATAPRGSNELVITQAVPISRALIERQFARQIRKVIRPVIEDGQIFTEEYLAVEELPVESPKKRGATLEEAASLLPQVFVEKWDSILESQESARRWVERLEFARRFITGFDWPKIDDQFKLQVALAVTMGKKSVSESIKKDLAVYFDQALTIEQRKLLATEVPEGFTIPSGRFVKVDYSAPEQPTIEARLQEFFGWYDSPLIAQGKIRVRVQLLGPNYRPVQITSDLKGFWTNSYHDVRKELRARYPKHDWPENPLLAKAKQKK